MFCFEHPLLSGIIALIAIITAYVIIYFINGQINFRQKSLFLSENRQFQIYFIFFLMAQYDWFMISQAMRI